MRRARSRRVTIGALVGTAIALASSPAAADAADRIYWANNGTNTINYANLDGSGGGVVNTSGVTIDSPYGLSLDPAAGRIYWSDQILHKISFANLDGTGGAANLPTAPATVSDPRGLAVDAASGRIYWVNSAGPAVVSFAALNGSGGGNLNVAGAPASGVFGLALDRDGGRVLWSNLIGNSIGFARLDGSGGAPLDTTGATFSGPRGVAIDPSTNRLYWVNFDNDTISFASLAGGSGGILPPNGTATRNQMVGIAIDPAAGRIYWSNSDATSKISFANLNGVGSADLPITPAPDGPNQIALLKAPSPTAAPAITGASTPGSGLSCSTGTWASDLPGSFLFQAPQSVSYQWSRNGTAIEGASASALTADQAGEYRCTVTASNVAGSSSQTSGPFAVTATPSSDIGFGKLKRNTANGTAKLTVAVPGPGELTVAGRGVAPVRSAEGDRQETKAITGAGTVRITIKAKGKQRKKLTKTGRVTVKAKITFTATGGNANTETKTVKLIRKKR